MIENQTCQHNIKARTLGLFWKLKPSSWLRHCWSSCWLLLRLPVNFHYYTIQYHASEKNLKVKTEITQQFKTLFVYLETCLVCPHYFYKFKNPRIIISKNLFFSTIIYSLLFRPPSNRTRYPSTHLHRGSIHRHRSPRCQGQHHFPK